MATQRGSQILHYKKGHTFTIDIQESKDYFLIFFRSHLPPSTWVELMRYVNFETITKGKYRDSLNYTDIISNHETVIE